MKAPNRGISAVYFPAPSAASRSSTRRAAKRSGTELPDRPARGQRRRGAAAGRDFALRSTAVPSRTRPRFPRGCATPPQRKCPIPAGRRAAPQSRAFRRWGGDLGEQRRGPAPEPRRPRALTYLHGLAQLQVEAHHAHAVQPGREAVPGQHREAPLRSLRRILPGLRGAARAPLP